MSLNFMIGYARDHFEPRSGAPRLWQLLHTIKLQRMKRSQHSFLFDKCKMNEKKQPQRDTVFIIHYLIVKRVICFWKSEMDTDG